MKKIKNVVVCMFAGLLLGLAARLEAQQPFYQGQSIKIVVGFTSGGFMIAGRDCSRALFRNTFLAILK